MSAAAKCHPLPGAQVGFRRFSVEEIGRRPKIAGMRGCISCVPTIAVLSHFFLFPWTKTCTSTFHTGLPKWISWYIVQVQNIFFWTKADFESIKSLAGSLFLSARYVWAICHTGHSRNSHNFWLTDSFFRDYLWILQTAPAAPFFYWATTGIVCFGWKNPRVLLDVANSFFAWQCDKSKKERRRASPPNPNNVGWWDGIFPFLKKQTSFLAELFL